MNLPTGLTWVLRQIHDVILVACGRLAIIITSEVGEMFALADRILVLRDGAFVGEMHRRDFDQQKLLARHEDNIMRAPRQINASTRLRVAGNSQCDLFSGLFYLIQP